MLKISHIAFLFLITGLFFSTGCIWFLPEGDVPPNLVGEQNTKEEEDDSVPLKDAEAAMSGAIVRALIRNGLSAERIPMAFSLSSSRQNQSFLNLLHSTGMVGIVQPKRARFILESRLDKGIWNLKMLKPDGTVIMKKTVKYRQNP